MKNMITHQKLTTILDYNPLTGEFTWKIGGNGRIVGMQAGSITSNGYRYIGIDYHKYPAHHLALYYVAGVYPADQVDHSDNNRVNNRLSNLRKATMKENSRNRRIPSNNTTGYKGVCRAKGKFVARVQYRDEQKRSSQRFLGYFDDPKEAHLAYCKAAMEMHGEFANFG